MGQKIAEWIENIATGRVRRAFWTLAVALFIWGCLAFPYIDATYFFYTRVENRIDNLERLTVLSGKAIHETPELMNEYNDILQDMNDSRKAADYNIAVKGNPESDKIVKFWSGASVGIIFILYAVFVLQPEWKMTWSFFFITKLPSIFFGAFFTITFGMFATCIPTFTWVWVNAILVPIAIFVFLKVFVVDTKK